MAKSGKVSNCIIRPNLFDTVNYALNTIRRIARIRRMTHPCCKACGLLTLPIAPPKNDTCEACGAYLKWVAGWIWIRIGRQVDAPVRWERFWHFSPQNTSLSSIDDGVLR